MSDSMITKQAIAMVFKKLMAIKSFDKISIVDITKECGLNRQTFYYHFEDKYDLMNWIYYNEIFLPFVNQLDQDYYLAFLQMFQKIELEKEIYRNALINSNSYGFKDYMFQIFLQIIKNITNEEKKVSIDTYFYSYGLLGITTEWIVNPNLNTAEIMATSVVNILTDIRKKFQKTNS